LRWRRRLPAPRHGHGRWLVLALLLAGAAAAVLVTRHSVGDGFERLLAAGCDEVEPCRALEAESAERLARCGLSCEREREQQREARQLLHRAEERRRVREHYRQSAELEGRIQEDARTRRIADEQRVLAAQARAEERLRKEQLESEQAERERVAARAAEQRARELRYLTLMSSRSREQRLKRCHERLASCDALVELMLDAAQDDRERRRLVEINERALEDKYRGPAQDSTVDVKVVARHDVASETSAGTALAAPAESTSAAAPVDAPCAGRAEGCCVPGATAACPDS
ncbi:MAG: hypothetical protein ABW217_17810, partial [Polyangiaceae bacterium]